MTNEEAVKYLKEAIDVINHQKTEIEVLKDYSKDLIAEISNLKSSAVTSNVMESQRIKRETKAEAIKEFAEHLKERWSNNYYDSPDVDFDEFVNNLVKEMVGED